MDSDSATSLDPSVDELVGDELAGMRFPRSSGGGAGDSGVRGGGASAGPGTEAGGAHDTLPETLYMREPLSVEAYMPHGDEFERIVRTIDESYTVADKPTLAQTLKRVGGDNVTALVVAKDGWILIGWALVTVHKDKLVIGDLRSLTHCLLRREDHCALPCLLVGAARMALRHHVPRVNWHSDYNHPYDRILGDTNAFNTYSVPASTLHDRAMSALYLCAKRHNHVNMSSEDLTQVLLRNPDIVRKPGSDALVVLERGPFKVKLYTSAQFRLRELRREQKILDAYPDGSRVCHFLMRPEINRDVYDREPVVLIALHDDRPVGWALLRLDSITNYLYLKLLCTVATTVHCVGVLLLLAIGHVAVELEVNAVKWYSIINSFYDHVLDMKNEDAYYEVAPDYLRQNAEHKLGTCLHTRYPAPVDATMVKDVLKAATDATIAARIKLLSASRRKALLKRGCATEVDASCENQQRKRRA